MLTVAEQTQEFGYNVWYTDHWNESDTFTLFADKQYEVGNYVRVEGHGEFGQPIVKTGIIKSEATQAEINLAKIDAYNGGYKVFRIIDQVMTALDKMKMRQQELETNVNVEVNVKVNVKTVVKRTREVREAENKKLYMFLAENHPTMLTTSEIAEYMGWSEKSTTSFIKTAMKQYNITNPDYNYYTIRKSSQEKYKTLMEVK